MCEEWDPAINFSQDSMCIFVQYIEQLYDISVAAALRECPFLLSACLIQRPLFSDGIQWYHECIDELISRLHNISHQALLGEFKKISCYRRPALNLELTRDTLKSLVIHVLRRVLHLLAIDLEPLIELVLSFCPEVKVGDKTTVEYFINIIVEKEYGHYFQVLEHSSLSKPVLSRNDRAKLSRGEKKIRNAQITNQRLESYEASWPSQYSQSRGPGA